MKAKIVLVTAFITVLLATTVIAQETASTDWQNNLFAIVEPPPEPTTGNAMCSPYAMRNVRCSQFIKIYDQCIQTMQGTEWQTKTEDCTKMGTGWGCSNGECTFTGATPGGITGFDLQSFVGQYWWVILIIVGVILWKKKKL